MIRELGTDLRRDQNSDDKIVQGEEIPRAAATEWVHENQNRGAAASIMMEGRVSVCKCQ